MQQPDSPDFSRRLLVQTGLIAGISATLPGCAATRPSERSSRLQLITKAIPSTGEKLPVIGIGASQFGEGDPQVERDVVTRMYELGGTVIDTAGRYTGSEVSIGNALQESNLRAKMFISTKFNAQGVLDQGVPTNAEMRRDDKNGLDSFERSLQRLHTDKIDLLMSHWIGSVEPLMPVMLDLKKAGRVRYIGISNFLPELQPRVAEYMRKYPLDFVQVQYRLNDRSAEQEIFPLALERKVAVMVAAPFGGARDLLFRQIGNRQLPQWTEAIGVKTWGQFFLKYVVSHPVVTCAIPGTNDIKHLEDNQAAGFGRLPDATLRKRMEEFWSNRV
jgi:aryl-alcohol dehydrogenase-like predicted oxidoreductase